jgi:hypothetical protein
MPTPVPRALISRNPLEWLRVFGPGAIIASLTIGTGELIFSTRGGAIFGYPILFLFAVICLLKWTLAYSAARHMVITGVHPFQNWMDFPLGPRGWLPMLFFLLAAVTIPVWVGFHSSVLGDLLAGLTDTKHYLSGATVYLWGIGLLIGVFALAVAGGYAALERIQLVIVAGMLVAVIVTLIAFGPDWIEFLLGFVVPQRLEFPDWLLRETSPAARKIAERPVWIELSLYVGVIAGAGYDYLAYTSYLRDKQWGNAAHPSSGGVHAIEDEHTLRQWLRAPLIDCTLSFVIVLVYTAVFVAAGKLLLGPARQIPSDGAFFEYQAQFVTFLDPRLYWLYILAVFLTMLGTLYGTLEVAPTVLRETVLALGKTSPSSSDSRRMRMLAIAWCASIALIVLTTAFIYQLRIRPDRPPGLTDLLKPANLFTGVFACGLICLLNLWMNLSLPRQFRMPWVLVALNLVGGVAFVFAGLRGYWAYRGWLALGILAATFALGIILTWFLNRVRKR